MCKLNKIKNKEFIIYRIVEHNYIGVTTNLHKRLLKHKSKNKFNIDNVQILETHTVLETALKSELNYQYIFNCDKGVRNQTGSKNPSAKQVICLKTGIIYDTIKNACEAMHYEYSYVRKVINDNSNKFSLIKV